MDTLARFWWHTVLALIVAGMLAFVGALIADHAPAAWIESAGIVLTIGAILVGAPVAFVALELRAYFARQRARDTHTSRHALGHPSVNR